MTEQERQDRKDYRVNRAFTIAIVTCIAILAIKNLVFDNI